MKQRPWWLMPKEPFWTPSRIISGLVFIVVFAAGVAFTINAPRRAIGLALVPVLWGLFCIWFPQSMTGIQEGPLTRFDRETPAGFLYWLGWVMLIVPGILFVVL